jgi:tetratricopeptide (TPR) repeat protein
MKRPVIVVVGVASLVAAIALLWVEVRREREFRRLIAVGDAANAGEASSEAIEAFSGAIAFKPDAMLAHLKRGETYLRRGDLSAALRDLREAARLDPTAPQPIERLGDVHAAMGRHDEAARSYEQYLALDDRVARVLYKLGLAHYAFGEGEPAVAALQRAIALDARVPEVHYLLGVALRATNRPAEALPVLLRAVELDAASSAAREELADLYAQLGRRRESVEQLEAVAALERLRPEPLVRVAFAYARLGRHDSAIATLGRAADRYPDSSIVGAALGRVWLDAAEDGGGADALRKALDALRPAAQRADATSETLTLYGRALLLSGDAAGAEQTLQQAVERLPVDALAFRHLSDAARRRGHVTLARDAAAKYAALTGDSLQ